MATTVQLSLPASGPRVRALEAALRTAIRDGRLATGTRLPPTRTLADDLSLARATVVEAYAQLQAEGYLSSRRGAGTWVAHRPPAVRETPQPAPAVPPARFSFNPGLPDLTAFPHAAWARALRRGLRVAPAASLGYGDPRGRPELRETLAAYLARARGVVADPETIVVCAGFSHGLSTVTRVLRRHGVRAIAVEDPGFWWHRRVAVAAGLEVVPLPVDAYGARTERLPAMGAGAALLTPAHQFPLGALLHPARRAAAITWARTTGGVVIEDDYDAELRYDRAPIGALQALDPDRVVYAGTASKTLAPGLRLGWLVLPRALVDHVVALRRTEDVHVATTEQIAFAELIRSGEFERHVRRMRVRYRARRDRLLAMLADRAPAARPVGISAGLRVLLELPPDGPSAEEIAAHAASRSIELFPVRGCHREGRVPPGTRDGLVLGYAALAEHDFDTGLAALGDTLAESLAVKQPPPRARPRPGAA